MKKINAVIRKNYGIDPLKLSDIEWSRLYNEHLYLEEIKLKNLKAVFTAAIVEALNGK